VSELVTVIGIGNRISQYGQPPFQQEQQATTKCAVNDGGVY
jgi:hypothetical protein